MSGYDQEIEQLMAEYRTRRNEADTYRRRINSLTGTATAPRRVVKVTVSARGEVAEIEFPTGAFRRLSPKELGDVLKATIAEARAKALEEVDEIAFGNLPLGLRPSAALNGTADLSSLLPEEPEPQERVRDYMERGVREAGNGES
ncbi:hypothetical protein RVR_2455 [Actinacidiphila reveromycinica]|uniref:Uncharacterized protein n=1 Tax=Actinacidiphila reveromycinica TaxID=659352 RepID=A0A7U3UQL1_9ACTN|nr:YbaB/EbfC family nucleoid-associated protein [Streptomyces sp. SN-593]BBA96929.1 hypothetical protein RVR_2455 [Streptomyces sp. SN-593]